MKTVVVVQARMGSTRLPGKVLRPVLGRPLLEHLLERLGRVRRAQSVVVATSTLATDDPIVETANRCGIDVHRGSESDVLARFQGAAAQTGAEVIVRVTADCPLIDPTVIDRVIELRETGFDYASNCQTRSFPRGMDTEVFTRAALETAFAEAVDPPEREHVTPFIWRRPDRFRLGSMSHPVDLSAHRWTVDTPEDFELIRRILEALQAHPQFTMDDCLKVVEQNPEWSALNAHIEQREVR